MRVYVHNEATAGDVIYAGTITPCKQNPQHSADAKPHNRLMKRNSISTHVTVGSPAKPAK